MNNPLPIWNIRKISIYDPPSTPLEPILLLQIFIVI